MNHQTHSEYSAQFQLELLELNPDTLKDPILILGSGTKGNLVHMLKAFGHAVCGIDPEAERSEITRRADFLNVDYGNAYWATIISPLGFSRELVESLQRNDGSDIDWVKCYKRILNALKPGGCFIYAPSLPFLEDLLKKEDFTVRRSPIRDNLTRTVITRK